MTEKTVVIIGAGPAGLTAALEILRNAPMRVVILEASEEIGGISRTVNYKGNRIDIGGHRFFSKSDWVMDWWRDMMPIEASQDGDIEISYQNKSRSVPVEGGAATGDDVMMIRNRLSRIYYNKNFFSYPVKADFDTAMKLGPLTMGKIGATYAYARAFQRSPEASLEDFLLNRFGSELYETFFRDYTEKVWGVPCSEISAEWGAQRIKGLNVTKAILHALKSPFQSGGLANKSTNTSLIESFMYPKYGPGQMWEIAAQEATRRGADLRMGQKVVGLDVNGFAARSVTAEDARTGERHTIDADYVVSTMPVRELVTALGDAAPQSVQSVAQGLEYRDFITVGLLLNKLRKTAGAAADTRTNLVPDNWIYIQDKNVTVGRLQFFNNWSPYMVADPQKVWVGMEYFCNEGEPLWTMSDSDLSAFGVTEMARIGLADERDLLDSVVIRQPKAYPGYFGAYSDFDTVRIFTDAVYNLFLVGRNGMHRYNNQDHSMLTARCAAEAIVADSRDKSALWDINVDDDYHEEKAA